MEIRKVNSEDAVLLRTMARKCEPLDVHTPYTYWVVCNFFGDGCFVLQENQQAVGYVMTLIKEDSLFVWQIGILEEYRGKKHSRVLLTAVERYAREKGLKKMLVSIAPENRNSYHAFHQYCKAKNISIVRNGEVKIEDPSDDIKEYECIYEMTL